jgi:DNA-binding response OmpR family regulator
MKPAILIVEDDRRIAALVAKNLEAAGYACAIAGDGDQGLAEFERLKPALVVLDVGLPGLGGLEVTRRIRQSSDVPILMLTARSSESDKVAGLEIGAADYLTKPFGTSELVARVRALLRRMAPTSREQARVFGPLRIDPERREAERDGERVRLTTLEFDLLWFLASRPGRVFSRDQLLQQVWGDGRIVGDRSIDSLMSRLRKKLEADPDDPRWLQTVWGAGYRFSDTEG